MVKQLLKGSVESLSSYIDPEKEEQLKCVKLEVGTKVDQILTLAKSIDKGNKDAKLRKKSELTKLVDDFHKQYESLYDLYDNLRGEIRQKVYIIDDDGDESPTSTSNSDLERFYSPTNEDDALNIVDGDVLKDKLTSASLVLETISSIGQVPESIEFVKDLGIETGQYKPPHVLVDIECGTNHPSAHSDEMVQKLLTETSRLKEMITEKEDEMLSLSKKHQLRESEILNQIKELETQLANVKQDSEKIKFKSSTGTKKRNEEISKLQAEILDLKSENQKKGDQLSFLENEKEQNEFQMRSKSKDLTTKVNDLENELDKKGAQLSFFENEKEQTKLQMRSMIKDLKTKVNDLQNELDTKGAQLSFLENEKEQNKLQMSSKIKDLTTEVNDLQNELNKKGGQLSFLENEKEQNELHLRSKIKDLTTKANNLQYELDSLHKEKKYLEDQLCSKAQEEKGKVNELTKEQSLVKKEHLEKIYDLHASLSKKEDNLSSLRKEYKVLESEQNGALQRLNEMEKRNLELMNKVSDQEKMLVGMKDVIIKLKDNQIQRKMDEIAEEFLKQFEDHLCILSRRIRVVEQLQVEVKEWYTNTRNTHAQEKYNIQYQHPPKQDNEGSGSMQTYPCDYKETVSELTQAKYNIPLTNANDVLGSLDGVALKFTECTTHVMNRISKVSCELMFAKDWVMRKNRAMLHMKDDQDCLLAQLDDKEAEILVFRERVWKYEIRERELENLIKEREEYIIGLKEEKREAIRQLCVWMDYHRNRCDYYKKILTDIKGGFKMTT